MVYWVLVDTGQWGDPGMYDVVHLGSGTEAGSYVRGAKIWKKKKITI